MSINKNFLIISNKYEKKNNKIKIDKILKTTEIINLLKKTLKHN